MTGQPVTDPRSPARWLPAAIVAGSFLTLLFLERRLPLRERVENPLPRTLSNLAIGGVAAAAVIGVEAPTVRRVARIAEERRWGLVPRLALPSMARPVLTLALLDYTLYLWHVLLHRVPLLWRCHLVHHADLDLDTSTAIRFHAAELLLSLPWRIAQIVLIGVPRKTLSLWGGLTLIEVMFHHSNLRLPPAFERRLSRCIVTPRLHGIHHSMRPDERDSNFSSGLALWDFIHGSERRDVPQQAITIGLAERRRPEQVTLAWSLLRPFRRAADIDRLPERTP